MEDGKRTKRALCKLCDGINLAYSGGTSNLHNHVKAKYPSHLTEKDQEKKQLILPRFKNCPPARANNITLLVAEFVARDMHPISTIDGIEFQQLVRYMEPGYKLVTSVSD